MNTPTSSTPTSPTSPTPPTSLRITATGPLARFLNVVFSPLCELFGHRFRETSCPRILQTRAFSGGWGPETMDHWALTEQPCLRCGEKVTEWVQAPDLL